MHDSFTPLGGLVPLVNIQLGEVIFGGVGAGLYGMLVMVVLTRLHRRADGRAHARVPRQEDPGAARCRWRCSYVLVFPAVILVLTGASRPCCRAGLEG